jgi:hypothetical protein
MYINRTNNSTNQPSMLWLILALAALILCMSAMVSCKSQQKYIQPKLEKFNTLVKPDTLYFFGQPNYQILKIPYISKGYIDSLIPILN